MSQRNHLFPNPACPPKPRRGFWPPCLLGMLVCLCGNGSVAQADLVRLKSGGEVRGEIVSGGKLSDASVTLATLHGARVTIARTEIEFISRRPLKLEQYESRARRVADTVEAHWQLAEWCREQNLDRQRDEQLERIIELEPDHELAHRGLGHTLEAGVWMSRDERMLAQGYVRHKGRYITPQELELIEKTQAERDREQEWFQKVRLWKGWATGAHADRRQQGLSELQAIRDPDSVPALVKFLSNDANSQVRGLLVTILDEIDGPKPVGALVQQSLLDVDSRIRYESLNAIPSDQYATAMPLFANALKHKLNVVVRRAGMGLTRVGDERVIPNLMDALITSHFYRVPVRSQNTMSFRSDGSFAGGNGLTPELEALLRSGQYNGAVINQHTPGQVPRPPSKFATVKYDLQNREVLEALTKLTGENFGYDERSWKLWHAASKNGVVAKQP